jgi:hypothetical protein
MVASKFNFRPIGRKLKAEKSRGRQQPREQVFRALRHTNGPSKSLKLPSRKSSRQWTKATCPLRLPEVAKLPAEEQKAEAKKRRGGGRKKKVQPVEEDEPEETPHPSYGRHRPYRTRGAAGGLCGPGTVQKARNLHKQLTQVINEIALIDAVASQRMRTQLSARAKGRKPTIGTSSWRTC